MNDKKGALLEVAKKFPVSIESQGSCIFARFSNPSLSRFVIDANISLEALQQATRNLRQIEINDILNGKTD